MPDTSQPSYGVGDVIAMEMDAAVRRGRIIHMSAKHTTEHGYTVTYTLVPEPPWEGPLFTPVEPVEDDSELFNS